MVHFLNYIDNAVPFLAIVSYDAVVVPLLPDFLPSNVACLTRLSGIRMLLLDDYINDALSRDGVVPQFFSIEKFWALWICVIGGCRRLFGKACEDM